MAPKPCWRPRRYKTCPAVWQLFPCRPERSEGPHAGNRIVGPSARSFASLRMTAAGALRRCYQVGRLTVAFALVGLDLDLDVLGLVGQIVGVLPRRVIGLGVVARDLVD